MYIHLWSSWVKGDFRLVTELEICGLLQKLTGCRETRRRARRSAVCYRFLFETAGIGKKADGIGKAGVESGRQYWGQRR
jgi:hypothetical protein